MSTDITLASFGKTSIEDITESTGIKTSKWLPFVQLLQPLSKTDDGQAPGQFIFKRSGNDAPVNLGTSTEAYVVAIRGKATYFDRNENKVHAHYHTVARDGVRMSDEYKAYREEARREDDNKVPHNQRKYRVGLDVLMYVPSIKSWCTLGANTVKTIQAVQMHLAPLCADFTKSPPVKGTAIRLNSKLESNSKGKWYIPISEVVSDEVYSKWDMCDEQSYLDALILFTEPAVFTDPEANIEGAEKATGDKPVRTR